MMQILSQGKSPGAAGWEGEMQNHSGSRILMLGSHGNLGSQIVRELKIHGAGELYPWTRADCDLTDLNRLETKIADLHPTVIINTAAYNDVDACEHRISEQKKAIMLNVRLVDCLARLCQESKIKLIHFSTNYVFSGTKRYYTEYDQPSPINFYGLTKQLGEESIIERMKDGLNGCVIRVSNLFGPCGMSRNSKPSFFEAISKAAKKNGALNVVADERGCFAYTKDVARALAASFEDEMFSGIYHFVNADPMSWYEAAALYFNLMDVPVSLRPVDGSSYGREAPRPGSAVLVSTRSETLRSVQFALQEYLEEMNRTPMTRSNDS